jgi:hypothetical protein
MYLWSLFRGRIRSRSATRWLASESTSLPSRARYLCVQTTTLWRQAASPRQYVTPPTPSQTPPPGHTYTPSPQRILSHGCAPRQYITPPIPSSQIPFPPRALGDVVRSHRVMFLVSLLRERAFLWNELKPAHHSPRSCGSVCATLAPRGTAGGAGMLQPYIMAVMEALMAGTLLPD